MTPQGAGPSLGSGCRAGGQGFALWEPLIVTCPRTVVEGEIFRLG